jgi:anti-sigma regulatory factor (Ser/Thr protein kinase)
MAMEASLDLAPDPRSARSARNFLRATLTDWGLSGLVDVAALLTSELVTNAILHARTPVRLTLRGGTTALRVEVCDQSSVIPSPRHYSASSGTGRGLVLVDQLAQRWGTEAVSDQIGKIVWFELPVSVTAPDCTARAGE